MAEISAIFHWTPAEMADFSFEELVMWRNRAVAIWNRMNGGKE